MASRDETRRGEWGAGPGRARLVSAADWRPASLGRLPTDRNVVASAVKTKLTPQIWRARVQFGNKLIEGGASPRADQLNDGLVQMHLRAVSSSSSGVVAFSLGEKSAAALPERDHTRVRTL